MDADLPIALLISSLAGVALALFAFAARGPLQRKFQRDVEWLQNAMWRFSPDPFDARPWVLGNYVGAVVITVIAALVIPVKPLVPVIALAAWFGPRLAVERAWEKRRRKIDLQLPAAILQMSQSVAAGMTLAQAVERLSERAEEPVRTEFRVMANYWRHGADLAATFEDAKRRLRLPNFTLFASALMVNQKMGGNVVDTLDKLGRSLEQIERMRAEVYAATAEGRTNIKVLAVAPVLMLGLVSFMDWTAVQMLFTKPLGWALLGVCTALTVTGTFFAWRIVNADV
ncbi:MAG: type II secretion system F family protein [Planctomycetota bacterium]|nr:type II secretion system F family protein [Planctomycetota bacterium]